MIDPHIQGMLDAMAQSGFALPDPLEAAALRAMLDAPIPAPPIEIAERRDVTIGGEIDSSAVSIAARFYHPKPGAALPLTIFFHGGGWVHGTLETHDRLAAALAVQAGCAVLSVDYRLAPEHPFPAAYDDALASVNWAKVHAADLNIDARRIALAGDSAGGNLAAAAAQALAGDPSIQHQLLIYPALDATCSTASFAVEQAGFLSSAQMRWYWEQYAPGDLASDHSASPATGPIAPGTAPATIILAGNDPLHDEGAAYAQKLEGAGVATTLNDYPGAIHGFASFIGMAPIADEAVATGAATLRNALA